MGGSSSRTFAVLLVTTLVFAGCNRPGDPPNPSTSGASSPDASENACTPYPEPMIDDADKDTFRGTNAFAYTIGLICDHTGAKAVPRARVPGTPEQREGLAFLAASLREAGWEVSFSNVTGNQYETLIEGKKTSSAYQYYNNSNLCDDNEMSRMRSLTFSNVVAKGGTVGGPGVFLLMAHWDSKRFAEGSDQPVLGANDGAAGVGILLELARTIQADETNREIRLLLTDGEDGFEDCHPLAGSMHYAHSLSDVEIARIDRILLLDMVGDPDVSFYKGCGRDADLANRVWAEAKRLGVLQFKDGGSCSVVDDHTPFEERGMDAVDIIPPAFVPYWHTTEDTPDKLDAEFMGDIGAIVQAVLADVEDELPTLP